MEYSSKGIDLPRRTIHKTPRCIAPCAREKYLHSALLTEMKTFKYQRFVICLSVCAESLGKHQDVRESSAIREEK